jgi:protein TonB
MSEQAPIVLPIRAEAYGYAPPPSRRVIAFIGTSLIYAVVAAGLFLSFEVSTSPSKQSAPITVTLLPLAAPHRTPPKPKDVRKTTEKHQRQAVRPPLEPVITTMVPIAFDPSSQPHPKPAQASVIPQEAAPNPITAPPAPQATSNAPDSWEGRVLARLEKFRRYPGAARSARQQGVAYIRFRINRDGRVLSSALVRSSGYPALDQAALETLRRADPLPRVPADRPDEIELSVPVEFFIR